ncbi:MAG: hypothetical protein ACTSPE_03810 [Candidatus Thorarchaeota archaeon]
MSRYLRQAVALCTYANVHLTGANLSVDIETLTAQHCYSMRFVTRGMEGVAGSSQEIAGNAYDWLRYLAENGAVGVTLRAINSRDDISGPTDAASVGGMIPWFLEVSRQTECDVYQTDQDAGGTSVQRPWEAVYVLTDSGVACSQNVTMAVGEATRKLRDVLVALASFAETFPRTAHWSHRFMTALHVLDGSLKLARDEIVPEGVFADQAERLLFATSASWVFGGMGSWTDLSFQDPRQQEMYLNLTNALYSSICDAMGSAVNSLVP